jgi:hypothetical protein
MDENPLKHRWRWLRFSIRTLLIATASIAIVAWIAIYLNETDAFFTVGYPLYFAAWAITGVSYGLDHSRSSERQMVESAAIASFIGFIAIYVEFFGFHILMHLAGVQVEWD